VTFIAYYVDTTNTADLTVDLYPGYLALIWNVDAIEYRLSGTQSWLKYTGTVTFDKGEVVSVRPVQTAVQTFKFWEDATTNTLRNITMDGDKTITAYFLMLDDELSRITLTSYPSNTGNFSWKLPGMTTYVTYAGPFTINESNDLTVAAEARTGYDFRFWEDASTAAVWNVGMHEGDVVHTAYFLSTAAANKVTITLTAYPAASGIFYWELPGMTTPVDYTGFFEVNKTDNLTVTTEEEVGYTFRFWEELSTAMTRNVGTHTANAEYTAYFLGADKAIITLTASPVGTGTFSWKLPGMKVSKAYTAPFEVNKGDDLTVTAIAGKGYELLEWDDLSTATVRNVGTHTTDTEYTATFELLPVYVITATAGPKGAISPDGPTDVI
jgi:hypothetical protein